MGTFHCAHPLSENPFLLFDYLGRRIYRIIALEGWYIEQKDLSVGILCLRCSVGNTDKIFLP